MGAFKRMEQEQAQAPNGGHQPERDGYYGYRCQNCGATKGPASGWQDAKGYEARVCLRK